MDLADPVVHASQELAGYFKSLRDDDPVAWHDAPASGFRGFWAVTRHDDVVAICANNRAFTSVGGNVLATLLHAGDSASGRMLAVSDGSRHLALRKLILSTLTPDVNRTLNLAIHANTRRLVQHAVDSGDCDFASDVAVHIPLAAVCDLLGIPMFDRASILEHTKAALSSEDDAHFAESARLARSQLLLYFHQLLQKRKSLVGADSRPDVIATLLAGRIDGSPLSEEEVIFNCYSVMLGGDETTRLALIGAVYALASNPDQWQLLRNRRVDFAIAVEELLRWTTPALHVGRTVVNDVVVRGKKLCAGDVVAAWLVSANRDERVFARPESLELARRPNRHVAFSYGPHFCLGAHLARIEMAALIEALVDRVEHIEVIGDPVRIYSNFLAGFSSLPVRLTPRRPVRVAGGERLA